MLGRLAPSVSDLALWGLSNAHSVSALNFVSGIFGASTLCFDLGRLRFNAINLKPSSLVVQHSVLSEADSDLAMSDLCRAVLKLAISVLSKPVSY